MKRTKGGDNNLVIEPMFQPMFEDLFQPMFGLPKICQAIRFNGANNYGQFANRLIDPEGDVDIEFWTPSVKGRSMAIIAQAIDVTGGEFQIIANSSLQLRFVLGGGGFTTLAENAQWEVSTRYRVTFIGNTLTLYSSNNNVISQITYNRGTFREPSAKTVIGRRDVTFYFSGLFPDIRINGNYYPLADRGQSVQHSVPDNGNPLTLFNTVPEQWEPISCNLRPQP